MFRHHVPLHTIFSTNGFIAEGTEPTHVNSSGVECRLRKRKNVARLYRFSKLYCFRHHHNRSHIFLLLSLRHHHHISIVFPPPPPHFYCFNPTTATAITFLLLSLHHPHHPCLQHPFSIVFPPPQPPPPLHFHCFPTIKVSNSFALVYSTG